MLSTLQAHTDDVDSASGTPDGRRAVSASAYNTERVWDLETGGCLRTFEVQPSIAWSPSVTRDARRVIFESEDGTVTVRDLESGASLAFSQPTPLGFTASA